MRNDLFQGLNERELELVYRCRNSREILEIAKKEGYTLTEEQLEAVSGGGCEGDLLMAKCPQCGQINLSVENDPGHYICSQCGNDWFERRRRY